VTFGFLIADPLAPLLKYLAQPWYESTLEVNFGKHDKLLA
jgi:hypothetical protein